MPARPFFVGGEGGEIAAAISLSAAGITRNVNVCVMSTIIISYDPARKWAQRRNQCVSLMKKLASTEEMEMCILAW